MLEFFELLGLDAPAAFSNAEATPEEIGLARTEAIINAIEAGLEGIGKEMAKIEKEDYSSIQKVINFLAKKAPSAKIDINSGALYFEGVKIESAEALYNRLPLHYKTGINAGAKMLFGAAQLPEGLSPLTAVFGIAEELLAGFTLSVTKGEEPESGPNSGEEGLALLSFRTESSSFSVLEIDGKTKKLPPQTVAELLGLFEFLEYIQRFLVTVGQNIASQI